MYFVGMYCIFMPKYILRLKTTIALLQNVFIESKVKITSNLWFDKINTFNNFITSIILMYKCSAIT